MHSRTSNLETECTNETPKKSKEARDAILLDRARIHNGVTVLVAVVV